MEQWSMTYLTRSHFCYCCFFLYMCSNSGNGNVIAVSMCFLLTLTSHRYYVSHMYTQFSRTMVQVFIAIRIFFSYLNFLSLSVYNCCRCRIAHIIHVLWALFLLLFLLLLSFSPLLLLIIISDICDFCLYDI